ncbi:MAG: glutathione S-transferase family protein [Pseudomonadota bacterium]
MPVIQTVRSDIQELRGVHLYHFATSNCSQRVRFVLEEKGIHWESHHISLIKCENATPEFIAINPKGVVPVLVHDGTTVIESNDIIQYLDSYFDGPLLSPTKELDQAYLKTSLEQSSKFQAAFKLLMHEFLFKPVRRMNADELSEYETGTRNKELAAFMREFSSAKGFSESKIIAAIAEAECVLRNLEERLANSHWLSGQEFGLADISWVVNVHRFSHMRYPMESYPRVGAWLGRMRSRPAYKQAISKYESNRALTLFRVYTFIRQLRKTSVGSMLEKNRGAILSVAGTFE